MLVGVRRGGGGGASPEKASRALTRRAAREMQSPAGKWAWPARGSSFGAGAFTKVGDLLQALLLVTGKKHVTGRFPGVDDTGNRKELDAWVADCWDSMGDAGGWYPCFSRPFNDWELEAVASLLSFLQGKRLNVGMEDRVLWNASKNGIFSVKSLYNTLDSGGAVPFPWRIIWSPCVPTKVGFFAWEASWGRC
ncbi:hypothetical protein CK203_076958 [Vitis vinifera]|uniref:Reverse transcriptase zinc-binding domain-containing protein n=1 Tax=Vitis vinifera TaxID=29760 RepID=A0A438DZV3_VITVI|nr:hypothetical protein CK203_076958 [Vitis vinifera]